MRDLVELARRGDRDTFASLVHATSDRLYALASRILQTAASLAARRGRDLGPFAEVVPLIERFAFK